jgi:hypothetical protein
MRGGSLERDAERVSGRLMARFLVQRCLAENAHPLWIEPESVELVEQAGRAIVVNRQPHLLPLRSTNGQRVGGGYQYSVVFESEDGSEILSQYNIPDIGDGTLVMADDWTETEQEKGFAARPSNVIVQCELVRDGAS